jgi:hypothetical protein
VALGNSSVTSVECGAGNAVVYSKGQQGFQISLASGSTTVAFPTQNLAAVFHIGVIGLVSANSGQSIAQFALYNGMTINSLTTILQTTTALAVSNTSPTSGIYITSSADWEITVTNNSGGAVDFYLMLISGA